MKKISLLLILLLPSLTLAAAPARVIIIHPLESRTLDTSSLEQANTWFEESLLKTGQFRVLSEKELQLILEAQGLLLSGLFDESQVLTIGRLLPAEWMASGTIEQLVSGLSLGLKFLDLTTGQVLRAESASAVPAEKLETALRRLVFRLAGQPADTLPPADTANYFELTVTADYPEAEVFFDGQLRGQTPLLIDNVPAGPLFLEIKKGSLYYAESLTVKADLTIYADLRQRTGNLLIHSQPGEAIVTVGGTGYGVTEFIDNLPAETLAVFLRKPGYFWRGEVPIIADKTVRIDAKLLATSRVTIQLPAGATAQFYGENLFEEFSGRGRLDDLLPGSYVLEISRAGYADYQEIIDVGPAQELELTPELELSATQLAQQKQRAAELLLVQDQLAHLDLPPLYLEAEVPSLDLLALKNTFLALVPGLDLLILFDKPLLPEEMQSKVKLAEGIQFGSGLLFQSGLVVYLLVDDDTIRTTGLLTAACAGLFNLGMGIFNSAHWGKWSAELQQEKKLYMTLRKQQEQLRAEEAGN